MEVYYVYYLVSAINLNNTRIITKQYSEYKFFTTAYTATIIDTIYFNQYSRDLYIIFFMTYSLPFIHITDVGSTQGNGADSLLRIKKQYIRLGVDATVVPAGHSPLHVAFAGVTDLSEQAQSLASDIYRTLHTSIKTSSQAMVVALNCAPRNAKNETAAAQESHIFRIKTTTQTFVLYGPALFEWVLQLLDPAHIIGCDLIMSIPPYIADTSRGSQFRSAEFLPVAHVLEEQGKLTAIAQCEPITLPDIQSQLNTLKTNTVILPPDEYGNSRLLFHAQSWQSIQSAAETVFLESLYDEPITVCKSLTEVVPNTISIWPSSNSLPNPDIIVLNLGTRWLPGTTDTTDPKTKKISQQTSTEVGTSMPLTYEKLDASKKIYI